MNTVVELEDKRPHIAILAIDGELQPDDDIEGFRDSGRPILGSSSVGRVEMEEPSDWGVAMASFSDRRQAISLISLHRACNSAVYVPIIPTPRLRRDITGWW